MSKVKRHLPVSVTIAVIVHIFAIILLVVGYQIKHKNTSSTAMTINTVKATVINTEKLAEEKKRKEEEKKQNELERQKQIAEQERIKQEKIKQEKEKKRLQAELEEEKKKAREAEKRAEEEKKKAAEAKKQVELEKKKREEEAKKKAEEAKRLAEEKKRKEQIEQKKLESERAAEKQRLAKILEQEEAEINAAEEEAQRVAKAREMSRLIGQYQDALRSRIQSRWRKPLNDQPNSWCKVYVRQAPGGYIENVVIEQCNGDEAFRRSVEEAVWKSDPLPQPPSPELFDRDLRFKFIPETR